MEDITLKIWYNYFRPGVLSIWIAEREKSISPNPLNLNWVIPAEEEQRFPRFPWLTFLKGGVLCKTFLNGLTTFSQIQQLIQLS